MKRIITSTSTVVLTASMFALGLGFNDGIQARENEDRGGDRFECTAEELSGTYGVLADGYYVDPLSSPPLPASNGPFAAVGRLTVNPDKTFSLNLTQNFNGIVVPSSASPPLTGTFTLQAGCTGSLVITSNGVTFEFVVVDEGKEIQFMRTAPTTPRTVITGVAKRQES